MKKMKAMLAFVALLACGGAWAELNHTWRDGWNADPVQTVSYGAFPGQTGIMFAGQQIGIAAQVKLTDKTSANIINFGGDNRVVLATNAEGKYTLTSNVSALNNLVSEVEVTEGWHRYAMFVRRGQNGSGHASSVIVYADGVQIFKVTDGSFVTGPFRNLTIGGKAGNRAKGGHWAATEAAGTAETDEEKAAQVEADSLEMYPEVDDTIIAKVGAREFRSLAEAVEYANENATAEAPLTVKLVQACTEDVGIGTNVTVEMTSDNRVTGVVSGTGAIKLSHATTAVQGSLATWIGVGKMTFDEFVGTVHLAAGRFNATDALIPAEATILVTNGAQLFIDGGTWTNTIVLEGAGYGAETTAIGRAALRFENGNIDGVTIVSEKTGEDAPAIGSHNSNRTFAFKLVGTGDIRLVQGTGTHTYKFTNTATTLSGVVTVVDTNLTLEAEVAEGTDEFPNVIAGAGKIKKTGAGTLKLTGANTITGGLIIAAGVVEGTTPNAPITGSGTIVFNGVFPTTANALTNAAWTGTVHLIDAVKNAKINVNGCGNAGSKVKVSGLTGWIESGTPNVTANVVLEDKEDGTPALLLSGTSNPKDYAFNSLAGSGTLKITDTSANNVCFTIKEWSAFTGTIDSTKKVAFSTTAGAKETGSKVEIAGVVTCADVKTSAIVLTTETASLTVAEKLAENLVTSGVNGYVVQFDADTKTYTLAQGTVYPSAIEGGSTAQKEAFDAWVSKYGVTDRVNANLDAFILDASPTATQAELEAKLAAMITNEMLAALVSGQTVDFSALNAAYPQATFEFVTYTITGAPESAKFFKLKASFVPAN